MALRDQPYLPLYVQDFLTDEKLMECSASATGIYIRIMCIMHKSNEYGTILLRQKDKQNEQQILNFARKLLKHLPHSQEEIISGITELINEGVLQIENDKLFQKRMVRDNEISIKRAKSGSKGGFAKAKSIANVLANNLPNAENEYEDSFLNKSIVSFEKFWELYDRDEDKIQCETLWMQLENSERIECITKLPEYIKSTPDKQFRKSPKSFLKNKAWRNEIINHKSEIIIPEFSSGPGR